MACWHPAHDWLRLLADDAALAGIFTGLYGDETATWHRRSALWRTAVELWANREGRLHQRILWRRSDTDRAGGWDPILLAP